MEAEHGKAPQRTASTFGEPDRTWMPSTSGWGTCSPSPGTAKRVFVWALWQASVRAAGCCRFTGSEGFVLPFDGFRYVLESVCRINAAF